MVEHKKYLNLGCGNRFHPEWTNVDLILKSAEVIAMDLTRGIDFPDDYFEVVYHSHLLEHFARKDAIFFTSECYRILRPGGYLRVVVPDLELLARKYLEALEDVTNNRHGAEANHEWIMLNLYDQSVRTVSGGEMKAYISRADIENEEYIIGLWGVEGKKAIEEARKSRLQNEALINTPYYKNPISLHNLLSRGKQFFLRALLGHHYQAIRSGLFRMRGEVHQWMYDRHSLAALLRDCGFSQIIRRTAFTSHMPNWSSFNLDTEPDGTVYRPDSLYMEAIKSSPR